MTMSVHATRLFAMVWALIVIALEWRPLSLGTLNLLGALRDLPSGVLPLGPWFLINTSRSVWSILVAGAVLGSSLLLGTVPVRFIHPPNGWRFLPVLRVFTGYALWSLFVFGLSGVGLCHPLLLLAALFGVLAAGGVRLGRLAGKGIWSLRALAGPDRAIVLAIAVPALVLLSRILVPEYNEDSLKYHLVLPEQLLLRHHFPEPPVYQVWDYPLLAELPNVFSLALGAEPAIRLVMITLGSLGAASALLAVFPAFGAAAAGLVVAVALAAPSSAWVLLSAKNDLGAVGFTLVAYAAILDGPWGNGRKLGGGRVALAGFLIGCCVAVKPVSAAMGIAGTLLLFLGWRMGFRAALLCAFAGAVPFVPWLFKCWVHFADPLFPYGSRWFPAVFGLPGVGKALRVLIEPYAARDSAQGLAWTLLAVETREAWLLAAGLPFLLLRPRRKVIAAVAAGAVSAVVLYLVSHGNYVHAVRFGLSATVLMGAFGLALMADSLRRSSPECGPAGILPGAFVVGASVLALVLTSRLTPNLTMRGDDLRRYTLDYATGRIDWDSYRAVFMGSYGKALPILKEAMRGRKTGVLVAGSSKSFYGIPGYAIYGGEPPPFVWRVTSESAGVGRLAVKFRQAGIGMIIYDADASSWERLASDGYAWKPRQLRIYADYLERHATLVGTTPCEAPGCGSHWIYRIGPARPRPARDLGVLPGADAAFVTSVQPGMEGRPKETLAGFTSLRRLLPEVMMVRSMLGDFYLQLGDYRAAYPHVRAAAEYGMCGCVEPNYFSWAVSAWNTGRFAEAISAYKKGSSIYRRWPGSPYPEFARSISGDSPK
jgi:hypothetical protein